jgi:metallo-beta-lactamase class B
MKLNLRARTVPEFPGTAFLVAAGVGSGIMGERLAGGNVAIALLPNTVATGAALVALILTFSPVSGAHFNPAVTPAGHILLDTSPIEMLPQVMANIEKLGFKPQEVKLMLNGHGHFDHCGGFAEFKRRTGATLVAGKLDGLLMTRGGKGDFYWGDDLAYEPVKPDRSVSDGDSVELGGLSLTAHRTPGHTKGCASWSMRVKEAGKNYDVLFACGLTASLYKLTNNDKYSNTVEDERNTLRKLRGMHANVMLASHGFYFDLAGKVARQKPGAPNPFVDPGELGRHVTEMEQDFEDALQAQERQR